MEKIQDMWKKDTYQKNKRIFFTIIMGIAVLSFAQTFSSRLTAVIYNAIGIASPYNLLFYFLSIISVFLCIYLWNKYVIKEKWEDIYMGIPLPTSGWILAAFIMSTGIIVLYVLFVPGNFKIGGIYPENIIDGTLGVLTKVSIPYSLIFWGLILSRLVIVFTWKLSAIISALIYTLFMLFENVGFKLEGRILLLVVVCCFIEGISMALVTIQIGSVWSSVVIYSIYYILIANDSIISISMIEPYEYLFAYVLEQGNILIVGTETLNTIEVALPSIIAFTIIALIASKLIKKEGNIKCLKKRG